jgi:hypothetical protein
MFNELVAAINEVINDQNFHLFEEEDQFEVYFTNMVYTRLGNNFTRNAIPGHGARLFDIKRHINDNNWEVCEIGHQRSNYGYLDRVPGLVNKILFDYIKNYQFIDLNITSYAVLYFTMEQGHNVLLTHGMFNTIINLFPNKNIAMLPLERNGVLRAKILVVGGIFNINEVREIYQGNLDILQNLVTQHENGWPKHQILMGEINPWDNF